MKHTNKICWWLCNQSSLKSSSLRTIRRSLNTSTTFWNILNISERIQDDPRWIQGGSGSFSGYQSSIKKVAFWRPNNVQKTPPRSHMNPQHHPQMHKSPVLAHNIHKDCHLGVAGSSSDIYGAKHSPPSSAQRGPKGKIKGSTQKYSKSTSNASF